MTGPATSRAAFSVIELIVVIVILGVLAGALVPRIAGWSRRDAQAAALRAADVLSAAARRETLSGQTVAVEYDPDHGVRMLVNDPAGGTDSWREDPLVPSVNLSGVRLISAFEDTASLPVDRWRVVFRSAGPRAAVGIVLAAERTEERWRVDLPAGGTRAVVTKGDAAPQSISAMDLDADGKGDQPW